jgi:hypothetical protein
MESVIHGVAGLLHLDKLSHLQAEHMGTFRQVVSPSSRTDGCCAPLLYAAANSCVGNILEIQLLHGIQMTRFQLFVNRMNIYLWEALSVL